MDDYFRVNVDNIFAQKEVSADQLSFNPNITKFIQRLEGKEPPVQVSPPKDRTRTFKKPLNLLGQR